MKHYLSRWTGTLSEDVTIALAKDPPDLAAIKGVFGTVSIDGEEYIDCRGFTPTLMLMDVCLDRIDFSYSRFPIQHGFGRSVLDRCLFRHAQFGSYFSSTFIKCDLSHSQFRRVQSGPGCRFEKCNFQGVKFSSAELYSIHFDDCQFQETVFRKTELSSCTFKNCTFVNPDFGDDDTSVSCCKFVCPRLNLRWYDWKLREEKVHIAGDNLPWLDFGKAHVFDLRTSDKTTLL